MRSYANIVATLALFLALAGGTAFAATELTKNSVGSGQLKSSAVTTSKLKDGAVTGAKIQPETLAQITAAAAPKCPAGTVLAAGLCFETTVRPPTTMVGAMEICGRAGRVLPSPSELVSFAIKNPQGAAAQFEWAGQVLFDAQEAPEGGLIQLGPYGVSGFSHDAINASHAFRCALTPA